MRRVIRELAIGVGIIILLVVIAVTYEGLRMMIVHNRLQSFRGSDAKELPYVAEKLRDYNRFVRLHAVVAVLNIGRCDESTVPHLIKNLDDSDPLIREYSAYALTLSPEHARAAIPRLVKSLDDPIEAPMAAYVLCMIGSPAKEAMPQIITLLKQVKDKTTGVALIEGLGKFGSDAKAAIPHLQTLAQDPDPEISKAATKAIQAITNPAPVVPAIPQS